MPENNFKTSFIPSKPIQAVNKGGQLRGNRGSNFMTTITLVIFFATLIVAGGVYFYGIQRKNTIEDQKMKLLDAQNSFDPDFVSSATLLNNRIESVKKLLANHKSPSQIFTVLEDTTLTSLQFTSLDYSVGEEGTILITAKGLANDFETVVLQSDNYGKTGLLRDILFSGLQNTQQGVSFDLEGTVEDQLVLYRNSLSSKNIQDILNESNSVSGSGSAGAVVEDEVIEDGGFPSE